MDGRLGRRASLVFGGCCLAVALLASAAIAAVTWTPAEDTRTSNQPRTCDSPSGVCVDSAFAYNEGVQSLAVSASGTTHYLHSVWASDKPPGDSGKAYVSYKTDCVADPDPTTGVPPYCSGVYYAQSTDGGTTWSGGAGSADPFRVGPGATHVQRGAIATSGQYVYVAYVTTEGYWDSMCAWAPRVLYVRVNSNYGDSSAWSAPVRLSGLSDRVDFPSISASGSNVYVVNTDSASGNIMFHRSTDSGGTFTSQWIGNSRNTYDNGVSPKPSKCGAYGGAPTPNGLEGYDGAPVVAGNGTQVGAAWISNTGGKVVAKVSTDNGATWPGGGGGKACTAADGSCTQTLTSAGALGPQTGNHAAQGRGAIDVAADAGRIVFVWKDRSTSGGSGRLAGIYARTYLIPGGFLPQRILSCLSTSGPCSPAPAPVAYNDAFAPSVALFGTSGIGVSWSACPYSGGGPSAPCDNSAGGSGDPGAEVLFKESWDNGLTWWAGESGSYRRVAANTAGASAAISEFATLAYDKPGSAGLGCTQSGMSPETGCVRYLQFTGRNKTFFQYAMYLSRGTQT